MANPETSLSLAPAEFESALRLLSTEQQVNRRKLVAGLVNSLAVGIFLLCVPLALVTIWFDTVWGIALFACAGGAFVVVVATSYESPGEETSKLRSALGDSDLAKAANRAWEQIASPFEISLALVFFIGGLAVIGGLVWLIYDLTTTSEIPDWAVVLIVIPPLVFWVVFGFMEYREFKHFADVSILLRRLNEASAADSDSPVGQIPVTSEEFETISRAELQQAERDIQQAVETYPKALKSLYSVTFSPETLEELSSLSTEDYFQVRRAIDLLQTNPHSKRSGVTREAGADVFVMRSAGHAVTYNVDESTQRVVVRGIDQERLS